jgi:hypothetical protein
VQEKQQIWKRVLALEAKLARTSNRSYGQSLEDCTKEHMAKGVNQKYQAKMLATTAPITYDRLCGNLLHGLVADEIKKNESIQRCYAGVPGVGHGQWAVEYQWDCYAAEGH